jgi:hypothetical protein
MPFRDPERELPVSESLAFWDSNRACASDSASEIVPVRTRPRSRGLAPPIPCFLTASVSRTSSAGCTRAPQHPNLIRPELRPLRKQPYRRQRTGDRAFPLHVPALCVRGPIPRRQIGQEPVRGGELTHARTHFEAEVAATAVGARRDARGIRACHAVAVDRAAIVRGDRQSLDSLAVGGNGRRNCRRGHTRSSCPRPARRLQAWW